MSGKVKVVEERSKYFTCAIERKNECFADGVGNKKNLSVLQFVVLKEEDFDKVLDRFIELINASIIDGGSSKRNNLTMQQVLYSQVLITSIILLSDLDFRILAW